MRAPDTRAVPRSLAWWRGDASAEGRRGLRPSLSRRENVAAARCPCLSAEPCLIFITFEQPVAAMTMAAAKSAEAKAAATATIQFLAMPFDDKRA
jgi:hypothetical protein